MERMEYIDLRKVGREGLKEIRGQVVRLKELGKTGKEGVSNCEIVERGFSPKGRPPVLPVETKRQRVNMISAISSQGSVRFMVYQDAMNQSAADPLHGAADAHIGAEGVLDFG